MARGIGVGVFVGLTPSVGLQMVPALLLAVLFRGNKILAVLFTYVSNPITTIPMYGLEFYLGRLLLPSLEDASFAKIKDVVLHFSFSKLGMVGLESIIVLWTGGFIIAIPAGIISYFVFYRIIVFYRNSKELRWKLKRLKRKPVDSSDPDNPNSDTKPSRDSVSPGDGGHMSFANLNEPGTQQVDPNPKSVLRKKFLSMRKKFFNAQGELKKKIDGQICSRVEKILDGRVFSSILFYYPQGGESSLLGLLDKFSSKTILFPRVSQSNEIEPVKVGPEMNFCPGYKGIPEPRGDVYQGGIDVVLVPGIVFMVIAGSGDGRAKKLARIGYGGGFYDRFLSKLPSSLKIGVCYEFQKIQEDFSEPHDIELDAVITEERIYHEENNI